MYLRNAWYVAAWGHEVNRELRRVTVLGEHIAVYRTESGAPVALEDACPHRKLPLSMGRLKGDTVECGYHGMTFDCAGRCVRVPGQQRIPPKALVRSYPMVDRWGLVWIWMGDASRANPDEIYHVDHYDDTAWGINRGEAMDFDCHYLYLTDNLLDPSHVAWVHRSTFGEAGCEDTPLLTSVSGSGVTVSRWMFDREVAPLYQGLVPFTGRADRLQHYEVRYPSHAMARAVIVPAGTGGPGQPVGPDGFVMCSYNFFTPTDENHTRFYWFQVRNVRPDCEETSRAVNEGAREAFEEDRRVTNAVHLGMARKIQPNIDLGIDAGPLRFRRALERKIAAERAASPSAA